MKFLEEIVVDAFLPTVRSILAEELSERGLTQREIAEAVGVSQSAVSKYVHGEVDRHPAIEANDRVTDRIDDVADAVAAGAMDPVGVLIELEVLIRELEAPGEILATLHSDAVPALADSHALGRIHDPDSRVRQEELVRSSVRRAIRLLERSPGFVALLPQVGSNVVQALSDAESVDDVVGIPGRIIDVEGRVTIPDEPAFGVSGHLASVLLAARAAGSPARAALNIRYNQADLDRWEEAGQTIVEIPGDKPVTETVRAAIVDEPNADVVAQPGAVGVEPITYLLGEDAPTVVTMARDLIEDDPR